MTDSQAVHQHHRQATHHSHVSATSPSADRASAARGRPMPPVDWLEAHSVPMLADAIQRIGGTTGQVAHYLALHISNNWEQRCRAQEYLER